MKLRLSFLIVTSLFATRSWAQDPKKQYVPALVGFYNIENLYDTIDSPDTDDHEFLPTGSKQWTGDRYRRKLDHNARVIAEMGKDLHPRGVAILGLCEVENRTVVQDLVNTTALKERHYAIVHEDSPDRRGVDVALIHDPELYRVFNHRSYRLAMADTSFRTRDQLLVSGVLDGDTTHVIVCHWPSRRGGEKRSEPNRKAAAELARHIIDSLLTENNNAHILLMGDLNDDPVNVSVSRFVNATGDRKKAVDKVFFNAMYEPYMKGIGTLAWRDSWNLFDQIILSPALLTGAGGQYKYYGVRIFNEGYLRQTEGNFAGYPLRTYVGDTYQDGFSDHFPVFVILVKELE
ncbi:MAG TPA: endonuclease/exonuclease/phosphatase family protein [Flavobacteriales bacterium]|nr:endonuclease/exonuclease/phosphatase family protein [Flavobacteriales bacterium]HNU57537.1 endonuclease/exonuclease/phosphatase family protein [Flavobacteriales bacterium]